MRVIGLILLGLILGVLTKLILPEKDPGGIINTVLIGVAGSLAGGVVSTQLQFGGGWFTTFVLALIGAVLLLLVHRQLISKTSV